MPPAQNGTRRGIILETVCGHRPARGLPGPTTSLQIITHNSVYEGQTSAFPPGRDLGAFAVQRLDVDKIIRPGGAFRTSSC